MINQYNQLRFDSDEFWEYSGIIYAMDGVKDACLYLQDQLGLNVNLILLMMFISEHRYVFAFEDTQNLEDSLKDSDKILKRHRKKRRGIKSIDSQLYQKALQEELALEKEQQLVLLKAASQLFLHAIERPGKFNDQLAAMCIRKVSPSADGKPRPLPLDKLEPAVFDACASLGKIAEKRFYRVR